MLAFITSSRIFDTQSQNASTIRFGSNRIEPNGTTWDDIFNRFRLLHCSVNIFAEIANNKYYLSYFENDKSHCIWLCPKSGQFLSFDHSSAYCNFLLFHNFNPKRWCHFLLRATAFHWHPYRCWRAHRTIRMRVQISFMGSMQMKLRTVSEFLKRTRSSHKSGFFSMISVFVRKDSWKVGFSFFWWQLWKMLILSEKSSQVSSGRAGGRIQIEST